MEAKHVIVIQRNHKFLKELLIVEPVLDALLQDGVFTQEDYDNCRQAGPGKCEMLLEILKKKGVEGYRTLCGVLDSTQPFIKERLDATSLEGGSSDLVYVNKFKLEARYSKERAEMKEQMSELHSVMEKQKEQLKQKDLEHAEREEVLKQERDEHESQTEKLREEVKALKVELSKSNDDLQHSQAECNTLKKRLQEEEEAYEALSGSPREQTQVNEDITVQTPKTGPSDRTCQFSIQSCCEDTHLCLLPCLHSACKPCIDHHAVQTSQKCLRCPCGREFNVEQLQVDPVGRNEAAYAAIVEGEKKCNYMEDHDAKAEVYCHECDCLLCTDCQKHHDLPKRNRGHSMDEVSQGDAIPMKQWLKEPNCKDHPSNELQLYDHTCKKAICIVCLHGDHGHHKNQDLNRSHENAKLQLEEQLQKQRLKLKDVKDTIGTVNSHQEELDNKQRKLEEEVTAVSKRVAVKFLHRQRKLREEIQMALDNTNKVVQEKLDSLHDLQSSIISTIDYTQRTLESTRRDELITITGAIQEKCDENLKRDLPEDDTRDTNILLSFQGQTALEELIDTFGGLASSLELDHIPDSQPTLQGLLQQINLLTEENVLHEGRWRQLLHIIHHIAGNKMSDAGEAESERLPPSQMTSQDVYEAVTKLTTGACIFADTIPRVIFLKDKQTDSCCRPPLRMI
ncbi:uncharacterized protein LOC124285631 isoform X2 [Haliotis rubra]|uniref:uncharacterized protein LOC124285631 isoform X2 n=1 Tax=Haliotis rubra TaxID=36100 RepID=UPI001EE51895|nr:uncharacterized protein LOC124285631 isoform X2 [Haliotis rubra]